MSIDPTDPRAPYRQVADELRAAIQAGTFGPGDRLPSERELAQQYGISHMTVRQAIAILRAEGLVDAQRGRGVFVRRARPWVHLSTAYLTARAGQQRGTWRSEAERQSRSARQDIREVVSVVPPAEVADRLGLGEGEEALVRRRVMFIDNQPVQLADSYFPLALVRDSAIAQAERIPRGVLAVLEDELNVVLDRFVEDLTFRMPTPQETRALQLPAGVPVVRLLRTTYGTDGSVVQVEDCTLAGDSHILTYEFPARA